MKVEKSKKIPAQWKFLITVLLIYIFIFAFNSEFAKSVAGNFFLTLKEIIPIVIIVFFVMFILNLFIKPKTVQKHLGQDSGLKGWIYTIIGSIFISGPPYVLMPMLSDLKKHGMKTSLLAVFLSNRSVQPVFIPVMAYYFGWSYAILISIFIILFSVWNGFVIGKVTKET